MYKIINPATNEIIKEYPLHTTEEIEGFLQRAKTEYHDWSRTDFSERSEKMRNVAQLLKNNSVELGKWVTKQMGMPISMSKWEVSMAASFCEYYAENAETILQSEKVKDEEGEYSYKKYEPLGPLLAIMTWNFPFSQVFRFASAAIMAGTVVIRKHASSVPKSALDIENIFQEAGIKSGVFQNIFADKKQISQVIEDSRI